MRHIKNFIFPLKVHLNGMVSTDRLSTHGIGCTMNCHVNQCCNKEHKNLDSHLPCFIYNKRYFKVFCIIEFIYVI